MTDPAFLGRHLLAGLDGINVDAVTRDLILKDRVGGFTLFKWNIESPEQLRALTEELQALAAQAGYQLLLAVDQEGGRVERLPRPFNQIRPMREWAAKLLARNALDTFELLGRLIGAEVSLAGFNLDFAPVIDVDLNPDNPVIGDRSFSADPEIVSACAAPFIRGLLTEGILPCLKHFPGHGATLKDSHYDLPEDGRSLSEINSCDVKPYRHLIQLALAPAIMTAHVLFTQIDREYPGTLSKKIVDDFLRQDLKYQGIIFSDDLTMKAIADRYELADATCTFLANGGDIALVCKNGDESRRILGILRGRYESNAEFRGTLDSSQQRIREFWANLKAPQATSSAIAEILDRHQKWIHEAFA